MGPCRPDPWYFAMTADQEPVDVVTQRTRDLLGEPLLVHSTSWRRIRSGVVLTFVVVISERDGTRLAAVRIHRAGLARSAAKTPPSSITTGQVLEHGLRHLAWLMKDDDIVHSVLGRVGSAP